MKPTSDQKSYEPNAGTIEAMEALDRGEGEKFSTADQLLYDLGIAALHELRHSSASVRRELGLDEPDAE